MTSPSKPSYDTPTVTNNVIDLTYIRRELTRILNKISTSINEDIDLDSLYNTCGSLMDKPGGAEILAQAGFVDMLCNIILSSERRTYSLQGKLKLVSLGTFLKPNAV